MKFSRNQILRRCLLSSAVLAGSVGSSVFAAEEGGLLQGLITGRKVPAQQHHQTSDSTTVQAELQKLFQTGQVQTSQHVVRPATESVQKVQYQSSEGGLFRQIFGERPLSERRAERQQQRSSRRSTVNRNPSVPKPPPIDYRMPSKNRLHTQSISMAKEVPEPPSVPPVGVNVQVPQPAEDASYDLKPGQIREFVSPFIDDETLERTNEELDLDSLIERPVEQAEAAPITTDDVMVEDMVELSEQAKAAANELLEVTPSSVFPPDDTVEADVPDAATMPREVVEVTEEIVDAAPVAETIDPSDEAGRVRLDELDNVEPEVTVSETESSISIESRTTVTTEETVTDATNEMRNSAEVIVTEIEARDVIEVEAADVTEAETQSVAVSETEETVETQVETDSYEARRQAIQAENARRQQQRYLILSRAGRTGFKGFCPVALRETRTLRDSSKTHSAKFGLKTYHFSSEEARARFEANPARYAPAAGGCDVVLLANTGEAEEGSLDFCLWYRDRLYMFRSRETQAIFSGDPARFANQY